MNLKNKDFLTLLDYSPEEIRYLLDLSKDLKEKKHKGISHKYLKDKNVVVTKIAHGIPLGADMEYIDTLTLSMALDDRKKIS